MGISKQIAIIGVPMDLGANIKGSKHGPKKIRQYLLPFLKKAGVDFIDLGDIKVPKPTQSKDKLRRHMKEIRQVCVNFLSAKKCEDCFLIVIGGDHSIVSCLMRERTKKKKLGLIWFDAHGDFNTPQTTPSGNIHGMPLAEIAGHTFVTMLDVHTKSVSEKNISMVGVRDLDELERKALKKSKITVFTADKVRKSGIGSVVKRAASIASKGMDGFHVSVDIDCIDPKWAPGVSTPVKDGLTRKDILLAMRLLGSKRKLDSIDFVELNPKNDKDDKTAKLVVEMIKALIL